MTSSLRLLMVVPAAELGNCIETLGPLIAEPTQLQRAGHVKPSRRTLTMSPANVEVSVSQPNAGEAITYTADVKPPFHDRDRLAMLPLFDLWSREDVSTHRAAILARLEQGTMPCDGAWRPDRVDVFRRWLAQGAVE